MWTRCLLASTCRSATALARKTMAAPAFSKTTSLTSPLRRAALPTLAHQTRNYASKKGKHAKNAAGKGKQSKASKNDEDDDDEAGASETIEEFDIDKHDEKMKNVADRLRHDYANLRANVAAPALLDSIRVTLGGESIPLTDVAQVYAKDGSTLIVQVHDEEHKKEIQKAIMTSNLNLNPVADSRGLKVPIPKITQDTRDQLSRRAKEILEKNKNNIRAVRQKAEQDVKRSTVGWSKDDVADAKKEVDTLTKKYNEVLTDLYKKKCQDILKF